MGALPNLPMIEGAIVRTCIERLGKPAHRARSAPGWLLHLPLALGILVTQAQEETFAATSGYVTLTVRHVERQHANWRTVENRLAQSPQSGSSPEFNPGGSSELDSAGSPEAKAPDGPEANPPGSSEILPGRGGTAAISIERTCQTIEDAARANELPVEFLTHLIWQESRFNPQAVTRGCPGRRTVHAKDRGVARTPESV